MNEDLLEAIETGDAASIRSAAVRYRRDPLSDGAMSHAFVTNPAAIPILVDAGVPVDERDTAGNTILMHAAAHGKVDLIEWLVKHGADVNASNQGGETPFSFACAWDQLDAAVKLHGLGAEPSPRFSDGTVLTKNDQSLSPRIRSFLTQINV